MFPFGIWGAGLCTIPRVETEAVTAEIFEAQERRELIVKLISGQDARKWDVKVLVEWASSVADEMLQGDDDGNA